MFIARKEILEKYCEWLFPILQFCEEKIGSKSDSYQNRYIGFLAERLLTVFLEYHKEYKVTRKLFTGYSGYKFRIASYTPSASDFAPNITKSIV